MLSRKDAKAQRDHIFLSSPLRLDVSVRDILLKQSSEFVSRLLSLPPFPSPRQ
jgi:hypothetical protein